MEAANETDRSNGVVVDGGSGVGASANAATATNVCGKSADVFFNDKTNQSENLYNNVFAALPRVSANVYDNL